MQPSPALHPSDSPVTDFSHHWPALLTASAACALIVLDTNIVSVALPKIATDLNASFVDIEWVVSAYMLTFAGGLLPAGSMADKFGRKRMLLIGLAVFMVASLGCGLAGSSLALNLWRAVKGIGAAALLTSALATIAHTFHREEDRMRAWAFWGGCMGMTTLLSPGLGGVISQTIGWRWVFLLNVPVGVALGFMVLRHIQASRDPASSRIDVMGALTFSAGLSMSIWALIDANRDGWHDASVLGRLGCGVGLFALFIAVESVQRRPMVDLRLFRDPRLVAGVLGMAAYAGCAQVMMTLIPQYLQNGLGLSAIEAGVGMLPFAVMMLIFPRVGVKLSARLPGPRVFAIGLVLVGAGNLLGALVATRLGYLPFAVSIALTGCGAGLLNGDTQKNIMACVPRERAGMASGISTTTRFSAIVMAFALLAGVLAVQVHAGLAPTLLANAVPADLASHIASRIVAGDLSGAMSELPAQSRAAVEPLARIAFAEGFASALLAAGVAALLSAAVFLLLHRVAGRRARVGAR